MVLWLAMATGAGAGRPADSAAAAQRHICGMWPKPGTQGCDGLLRVPLAQDNATREALGAKKYKEGSWSHSPGCFYVNMAVSPTQGGVGSRQAGQTLEGSFSAVSTPLIARERERAQQYPSEPLTTTYDEGLLRRARGCENRRELREREKRSELIVQTFAH